MSALEVKTLQSPNNFNLTLDAQGSGSDIIIQSNGSQVASITDAGLLTATTFAGSGASLTALPAAQLTGSLPAISGASLTGFTSSQMPTGSILQVVSVTDTTQRNASGTTFNEVSTDWRLSITPKSTSSKLILDAQMCYNQYSSTATHVSHMKFYDVTNSADVCVGPASGSRNRSTVGFRQSHADVNDVDPLRLYGIINNSNQTARTYTLYFRTESNASFKFNQSNGDSSAYGWTVPFVFTITEVAL